MLTDDYLQNYLKEVLPMCDGILGEIQKISYEQDVPIIPNEVVRLLSFILSIKKPKRILEIGAAVGFSSGLMSKFLSDGGKITTIDRFDIMIEQFRENRKKMGLEDKIELIEGNACEVLPRLSEKFDVIFLDAAKGQYIQMLPDCIRLLETGGILIADDVLQNGNIAKKREEIPRRQRTIHTRMRNFLWEITHNDALETSILTIGDGVALCCKVSDI
ncbi:MAG: O-methyltransferase [Clostridiales bacterium]|jgi:predicted O-methyltransferase YrrM|nr:O-methyltransferase [Clostridiales bacterium]